LKNPLPRLLNPRLLPLKNPPPPLKRLLKHKQKKTIVYEQLTFNVRRSGIFLL
jgi:hypothetical protein